MNLQRLSWRVGLPFVILTLVATATLSVILTRQVATEARARLAEQAAANARFLELASLPPSERMAEDLRRVTGLEVFFRIGDSLLPRPTADATAAALMDVPADGKAVPCGTLDVVAVALPRAARPTALLLAQTSGGGQVAPRLWPALLATWSVALVLAWLVGRSLVRPLRHLTAQLPYIDAPDPPRLPEANRRDELGDVARALLSTHAALRAERGRRERAEQLAALGRMATALAHEIQNPVAAIQLHSQLLKGTADGDVGALLEHEAGRIEDLLNQWLFLARPAPPAQRRLDLRDVVHRSLASQSAMLTHARVTTEVHLTAPLPVAGDARRLEQVFGNLLRNGIQAMPHGGTLRVVGKAEGCSVVVAIDDQGSGFPDAVLQRLGEMFFSTKEGGMGIGLAVAMNIVQAHHGTLAACNLPHAGASVVVKLPVAPAEEPT